MSISMGIPVLVLGLPIQQPPVANVLRSEPDYVLTPASRIEQECHREPCLASKGIPTLVSGNLF